MDQSNNNVILVFIDEIKEKVNNITFSSGDSFLHLETKPKKPEAFTYTRLEEIISSTLSILSKLYGENHNQVKDFIERLSIYRKHPSESLQKVFQLCIGKLNAVESDIKFGLLQSIEKEISGEIFSDFIKAAKLSFDEGFKEVSAVLACAALEDLLKRLGKLNSLNIEDKTMSDVVNALKKAGVIKGAQTNLISAYVTLRNKTFHAQWDKIENADIKSLIVFTEEMLLKHFT